MNPRGESGIYAALHCVRYYLVTRAVRLHPQEFLFFGGNIEMIHRFCLTFLITCVAIDPLTLHAQVPEVGETFGIGGSNAVRSAKIPAGWKIIHPRRADRERRSAAIIRAPDVLRSDLDFAGFMLRCGTPVEAVVVVVAPFPPGTRPKVRLQGGAFSSTLSGTVISGGAGVLLPAEGRLADNLLRAGPVLDLEVETDTKIIKGSVNLTGLGEALKQLDVACRE